MYLRNVIPRILKLQSSKSLGRVVSHPPSKQKFDIAWAVAYTEQLGASLTAAELSKLLLPDRPFITSRLKHARFHSGPGEIELMFHRVTCPKKTG